MHDDALIRALGYDGTIRAVVVRSTHLAQEISRRLDAGPVASVALSRAATAALMMASGLKGFEQLALKVRGDGPLGQIYAIASTDGVVRATVDAPHVEGLPEAGALAPFIGAGQLTVLRSVTEGGLTYQGVVAMSAQEIAEDLSHYYLQSAQLPTAVGLGEWLTPEGISAAGGFFVQALPGATDADLAEVEARIELLGGLGVHLEAGMTLDELLNQLLKAPRIVAEHPVRFGCNCNRERYALALSRLPASDLDALREDPSITTRCDFCGAEYVFSREDLTGLEARS
ncbi:Hsp33 family molecular chaperone HslO [Myxococcota bacterium]|nr:Hsp33 family molecular chaperone HslO [Myxococcota bacterium]MBU1429441.1 Hsp33 family molecular chaperone HslO [Myxococcota bacterium]MBU1897729.1 Hsp33 family molecular chaperone HslO [Myxococcota bacterium]